MIHLIRQTRETTGSPRILLGILHQLQCRTAHKKKTGTINTKTPDNKGTRTTSARVFFLRIFSFSALAPTERNVRVEAKFGRADMSSLVHSRECVEATAIFRVLLRGGPRRWSLKIWFQVLEFSVSRTATAKFFFPAAEREGGTYSYSVWAPPAPCSFYSRKNKHLTSTILRETEISSAWNHIFKLERRGPPRKRRRKLLSLWHTYGSAPWSSYLSCQISAR